MFVAKVLVCFVFNQEACFVLEDNRGPYQTFKECTTRVDEIVRNVVPLDPQWQPVGWKCDEINDKQPT